MNRHTFVLLICLAVLNGCGKGDSNQQTTPTPKGQGRIDVPRSPPQAEAIAVPAGPPPLPTLSQSAVDYGRIPLGAAPAEKTIVIGNDAEIETPLRLSLPASTAFNVEGSCITTGILSPHDRCALNVTFQPREAGRYTDQITLPGTHLAVALAGEVFQQQAVMHEAPSYAEIQRLAILSQAQSGENEPPPPAIRYKIEREQADFTPQGWEKLEASLPADLHNVILRGTPLTAVTIDYIDTQLGCPVRATLSEDVYGEEPGPYPLLAKGSILTGECQGIQGSDQTRVAIIWDRIVTPDHRVINIDSPTLDGMGRAGVAGNVDTQFWGRYGKALLVTVLGTGGTYLANQQNETQSISSGAGGVTQSITLTPQQQAISNLEGELSKISQQMISDGVQFQTRIYLPKATVIKVFPKKDIWFSNTEVVAITPPSQSDQEARTDRQNSLARAVQYSNNGTEFERGSPNAIGGPGNNGR